MNFTAIDFETADELIPCEIGICTVRDGVIRETRSWLIKPSCYPYMDYWCQQVHGITVGELENAPYFDDIWKEIKPYLDGQMLVAHNASFDMGVLRSALSDYSISAPKARYLCSVRLARRIWKDVENHKLDTLCRRYGIRFNHHRAGDDAEACAKIILKIAEDTQALLDSETLQLSLDLFRPHGISILEVARKLKIKPKMFT